MLNSRGFSLFEMLLILMLSSLLMMTLILFFPLLYRHLLQHYQQQRLRQAVDWGMLPMIKDIKRAGFMAKLSLSSGQMQSAIVIEPARPCLIIRYDLSGIAQSSDVASNVSSNASFAYRYHQHNIEYASDVSHCSGNGWIKLFDEREIKVTSFTLLDKPTYLQLRLSACLIFQPTLCYQYAQWIRYENR
ncbi:hypothetical protein RHO15_05270 [Utexia brackfieldae]|uniref:hypothetical protein n=1 Tax=Utexia brackfieldae TaxID=3074108 RepID=UPI00370D71A2